MSKPKMMIKTEDLLAALNGTRASNLPIGSQVDANGNWHAIFVSTDGNGMFRTAKNGAVIYNIKPSRPKNHAV